MVYRVTYIAADNKVEQSEIIDIFAVDDALEQNKVGYGLLTVFSPSLDKYGVYVEAEDEKEALEKARSAIVKYFDNQMTRASDYFSLKKQELFGFEVGDMVKVTNPGNVFSSYYTAMGELMSKAYHNLYYGPFVVGLSIHPNKAKDTLFEVLAKGKEDEDALTPRELYLIAESGEATKHRWRPLEKIDDEPLEVFLIGKDGLKKW